MTVQAAIFPDRHADAHATRLKSRLIATGTMPDSSLILVTGALKYLISRANPSKSIIVQLASGKEKARLENVPLQNR
ncbi:MAG: hypothetical protein ACRESZ_14560 [Methylococcales bacterium]